MKEPNVKVATEKAGAWAKHIPDSINFTNHNSKI